ncbi:MAG: hypothetical protein KC646_04480 [Candidatus Cloacimonetes bacterium]|nr:hypothetical protein [Candidatus Cloacimonadota bacterium]
MQYIILLTFCASLSVIWISIASVFTKHTATVIPLFLMFSVPAFLSLKKYLTYESCIPKIRMVLSTYMYASLFCVFLGMFALMSNKPGNDRILDIAYFSGFSINLLLSLFFKKKYRTALTLEQSHSTLMLTSKSQTEIDKTVIQIARNFEGNLTPIELTEYSEFSLEDSSKILEDMYDRGFLDISVDDNGVIIYNLKSIQNNVKSLTD